MAFEKLQLRLWPSHPNGFPSPFRKCPPWIPQAYWKKTQRNRVIFSSCYLFIVVSVLYSIVYRISPALELLIPSSLVLFLLFWVIAARFMKSRFHKRLHKYNNKICMSCGYPLEGLPDEHQCPECGKDYNIEQIVKSWSHWIKYGKIPATENTEPTSK